MQKWYAEDFNFSLLVLPGSVTRSCRLGLEPGDAFHCAYETPAGFCPTAFLKIFPAMEAIRGVGGSEPITWYFTCPDGVVHFRLIAEQRQPE